MRWGIALGAGACICIAFLVLILYIMNQSNSFAGSHFWRATPSYVLGLGVIIASIVGPVSGILIRDWLLRKRVRHILRARGTCVGCGYGLAGLPVSPRNQIICPECELLCEVDPSLGELSISDGGVGTFQPSAHIPLYGWWTPKRSARFLWVRRVVLRVLLIGLPAGWCSYEIFLFFQAKQAAAEKPNAAGILAIVESRQPVPASAGTFRDPDGWAMLELAALKKQELEVKHSPNPLPVVQSWPVRLDYGLIGIDIHADSLTSDAEYRLACQAAALAMMDHLAEGELFTQLDELAKYQRAVRPIQLNASTPAIALTIPSMGQVRQLGYINLARMHLALQADDEKAFLAACESNLAIARFIGYQPFLFDTLVSFSIEISTLNALLMALSDSPSPAFVAQAKLALHRQRVPATPDFAWDGHHALLLDTVCWIFSDTSYTRLGRFSPSLMKLTQGSGTGKLGTFSGNKHELDEIKSRMRQYASTPRLFRGGEPAQLQKTSDYLLLSWLNSTTTGVLDGFDQIHLLRGGADLMIAIEEFRIATGKHPAALSELVPAYIASLPVDPWSGVSIGYRLEDAHTDPFHRPYILYSVGLNGKDDGGLAHNNPKPRQGQMRYNLVYPTYFQPIPTGDFILNFPD